MILSCEALAFVGRDLSESPIRIRVGTSKAAGAEVGWLPLGEVVLGADDDTRYRAHATEVDNLVIYDLDHVEGFPGRDGVDEDEAVDSDGMFGIQNRVLVLVTRGVSMLRASKVESRGWWRWRIVETYLTGCVDDVALVLGALVVDALGEGAFDGGVIGLDKVVVDELDDQG